MLPGHPSHLVSGRAASGSSAVSCHPLATAGRGRGQARPLGCGEGGGRAEVSDLRSDGSGEAAAHHHALRSHSLRTSEERTKASWTARDRPPLA